MRKDDHEFCKSARDLFFSELREAGQSGEIRKDAYCRAASSGRGIGRTGLSFTLMTTISISKGLVDVHCSRAAGLCIGTAQLWLGACLPSVGAEPTMAGCQEQPELIGGKRRPVDDVQKARRRRTG